VPHLPAGPDRAVALTDHPAPVVQAGPQVAARRDRHGLAHPAVDPAGGGKLEQQGVGASRTVLREVPLAHKKRGISPHRERRPCLTAGTPFLPSGSCVTGRRTSGQVASPPGSQEKAGVRHHYGGDVRPGFSPSPLDADGVGDVEVAVCHCACSPMQDVLTL
jgi:hypothetical protein